MSTGGVDGVAVDDDVSRLRIAVRDLLAGDDVTHAAPAAFRAAQFDAGLAWVHFPEGSGGLGVDRSLQTLVDDLLEEAGVQRRGTVEPIGYKMAVPTLLTHGTPAQLSQHARPTFTHQTRWCQLFSEPGAGSDLANVSTRAIAVDDGWLVTGQKVWTSHAKTADYGLLLARTAPDLPKHAGLSFFLLDMAAPGIDVRPLRQLTGETEFNEVFLTDVHVPASSILGEVNDGWTVAMTLLANERAMYGGRAPMTKTGGVAMALDLLRSQSEPDEGLAARAVDLWVEAMSLDHFNARIDQLVRAGTAGVTPSAAKLSYARIEQAAYSLCLEVLGPESMLYRGYDDVDSTWRSDPRWRYLRSLANSIEGGTSEIQRNIIAERGLGLPREPGSGRSSKPWSSRSRTNVEGS